MASSRSIVGGLLAGALLTASVAIVARAATNDCESIQKHPGKWSTINVPPFSPPAGDPTANALQSLQVFASSPDVPGLMFIHNGQTLLRSTDGGCSWETSLQFSTVPDPNLPGRQFGRITVGPTVEDDTLVYLVTSDFITSTTNVLISKDAGVTWTVGASFPLEMPSAASGSPVVVAPSNPKVAYLGLTKTASFLGAVSTLYRTTDGGKNWSEVSSAMKHASAWTPKFDPNSPLAEPAYGREQSGYRIAVDPLTPEHLWAWAGPSMDWSSNSVFVSTDGGDTFSKVAPLPLEQNLGVTDVAIQHLEGRAPQVFATTSSKDRPTVVVTTDDGQTWTELGSPSDDGGSGELAIGSKPGSIVWLDWPTQGVRRYERRSSLWTDIHPGYSFTEGLHLMGVGMGSKRPVLYLPSFGLHIEAYSGRL